MIYTVLESPDGKEIQFVADRGDKTLDGYDGWTVLGTSEAPPAEGEKWDKAGGVLTLDAALKETLEREALARDQDAMLARIEALEARASSLETSVTALKGAPVADDKP